MRVKQCKSLSGKVEGDWVGLRDNLEKSCLIGHSVFNYTNVIRMINFL